MSNSGQDDQAPPSDKREGAVSSTESTLPTMRQSGTFEGFGNAKQQMYVRSDRLATEIQSDFGTATYWSTYKGSDGSSRRGNMRGGGEQYLDTSKWFENNGFASVST